MDPGIVGQKASIRAWARSQPRCSAAESVEVVERLSAWLAQWPVTDVLTYAAMPGEVDLDALRHRCRHRFHLTRTPPSGPLTIHPWEGPFERHPFGFLQPMGDAPEVQADRIGVVLTPGVAFDREGGRLGFGKGYYDELLTRTVRAEAIVGVTLERFILEEIPLEHHDLPMTHLATERGVTPALR